MQISVLKDFLDYFLPLLHFERLSRRSFDETTMKRLGSSSSSSGGGGGISGAADEPLEVEKVKSKVELFGSLRGLEAHTGSAADTAAVAAQGAAAGAIDTSELDNANNVVLSSRRGSVLGKGTILKSDHFPGAQNKKLKPIIDGAPNFRQVEGLPVYGVAIPTVDGILNVLREILSEDDASGASPEKGASSSPAVSISTATTTAGARGGGGGEGRGKVTTCCWHNMREEPVLYINGKPFVLREMEHPFANVEYTGITSARVEDMEQRMKQDVLKEVGTFGGVMVCEESEDGDLVNSWEAVEPGDVQTPREVYEDFKLFGYDVRYFRIPVTDERSPKEVDFDTLEQYVFDAPEDAALVFNCQMGRGRTTTAMIVASLLQVRRRVEAANQAFISSSFSSPSSPSSLPEECASRCGVPEWAMETFVSSAATMSPSSLSPQLLQSPLEELLEDRLKTGDYLVIRSLTRVLEKGPKSKSQIDAVIDACSEFQSLREGIVTYRARFLNAASESQRNNLQRVVIDYLERYFMLITFTSYLNTINPDKIQSQGGAAGSDRSSGTPVSFEDWVAQRSELYSMRERLLWHNPLTAMEVHTSVIEVDQVQKDKKQNEEDEEILSFIAMRNGAVLGSHTILKEDHYPGLQSHILKRLEGAPNFRRASERLPVFGLAIPTVEGIRRVLSHVGVEASPSLDCAGAGAGGKDGASLLWFNMREEPVIYMNGKPYVLREHARPFKNMQEYSNISTSRVENMEKRLKQDVIKEAKENNNSVLVTREKIDSDGARVINEEWETIDHSSPTSVLTPGDIFHSLQAEGYPIEYCRIPVTDGKAPELSDLDDIVALAAFTDPRTVLVFSCQGGAGRTTTGMVIGSLLHLRKQRKLTSLPQSVLFSLSRRVSLDPLQASSDYETFDVARDHAFLNDSADSENEMLHSVEDTLKQGNYAVIQRLEHVLPYGVESKEVVDIVIDACGKLKNLRKAIFAYRKPRKKWGHSWGRGDESLQGRHAAFKKGIEYLEKYFIVIAFASWLDSNSYHDGVGSFYEWFQGRSHLQELKKTIRTNPGAALSTSLPVSSHIRDADVDVILGYEHKLCLSSRSGVMLKRNTILKSYVFPEMQIKSLGHLPGVFNYYHAKEVPIASASAPTIEGMRSMLGKFKEESPGSHVVIVDLREELVIYVKGVPYVLREIDFATKSLNLAGISSNQVLQREELLKKDLLDESRVYKSQVLLHHEVSRHMKKVPSKDKAGGFAGEDGEEKDESATGGLSRDGSKAFDVRADAQKRYLRLEAFWEKVSSDATSPDEGVCTASDISTYLQKEGFSMSYFRFPWSRERSPTAQDLECLHSAVSGYYEDWEPGKLKFLFLSHTGIGMGVRNIPVFVSCFYQIRRGTSLSNLEEAAQQSSALERTVSGTIVEENRGILALTRVIPEGPKCKAIVDKCISYFFAIGDMRKDIQRCKQKVEKEFKNTDPSIVATQLLGLSYLKRYYFLIVYVCFLRSKSSKRFDEWFDERSELAYLIDNISL